MSDRHVAPAVVREVVGHFEQEAEPAVDVLPDARAVAHGGRPLGRTARKAEYVGRQDQHRPHVHGDLDGEARSCKRNYRRHLDADRRAGQNDGERWLDGREVARGMDWQLARRCIRQQDRIFRYVERERRSRSGRTARGSLRQGGRSGRQRRLAGGETVGLVVDSGGQVRAAHAHG